MYNKNLSGRASLTPEFQDGVKTFIEWTRGQSRHMNGDKIRCPCRKCKNTKFGTPDEVSYHLCMRGFMAEHYNWTSHGEDIVQDYFEAPSVPQVLEEPTPAGHVEGNYPQWGDEQYMDWAQRMIFYAVGLSYFTSSHEGVPDDGTRSCSMDTDQPLWDDCNQSQLGAVAELVDSKTDGHISERIYDSIFQWTNRIFSFNHTLPGDYYSTKKLLKNLGLPVEKIHACKNGCMLYWKDDVDLEYCKFCGDARYKPARRREPQQKKSPYAVFRYQPLTPRL
ncbi:hypothetical protein Sango_2494800 [Sesamum angolense]|uniref:Transposase-associated domain-containing protein n=1 Tax=Sesamum angolense TaxID=2727404 RepID=A0AAE1W3U7_9LAMI|nr:hypothetical protein Sango_2494800 [Sesamum angolense]